MTKKSRYDKERHLQPLQPKASAQKKTLLLKFREYFIESKENSTMKYSKKRKDKNKSQKRQPLQPGQAPRRKPYSCKCKSNHLYQKIKNLIKGKIKKDKESTCIFFNRAQCQKENSQLKF